MRILAHESTEWIKFYLKYVMCYKILLSQGELKGDGEVTSMKKKKKMKFIWQNKLGTI